MQVFIFSKDEKKKNTKLLFNFSFFLEFFLADDFKPGELLPHIRRV